jgi:hypothetical protein
MEITIKIDNQEFKNLFRLHNESEEFEQEWTSPYIRFFDKESMAWTPDPEMNKLFLLQQQNYANDKLRAKGHLFLNEVYDMLCLPRTKYGNAVGWIFAVDNSIGDNYVDFGIYNYLDRGFMDSYEKSILLVFNVDGIILDRI